MSSSSKQDHIVKDFLLPDLTKDGSETYLQKIRNVVLKHHQSKIKLKKMEKNRFKVGPLSETSYRDEPEMLDEWEQYYLPDHMFMEVIGVVENIICNSINNELVLMVCEDGKVFAYEDNTMHLISNNLKELFELGVHYPGIKTYYRGQSFENMTDEEWHEVKKSKEVREMEEEHKKMLMCMEDSLISNLDNIMGRRTHEPSSIGAGDQPIPVHQ